MCMEDTHSQIMCSYTFTQFRTSRSRFSIVQTYVDGTPRPYTFTCTLTYIHICTHYDIYTCNTHTQDMPFELQCRPDRKFGKDNVGMGISLVASFEFKSDLIPGLTTKASVRNEWGDLISHAKRSPCASRRQRRVYAWCLYVYLHVYVCIYIAVFTRTATARRKVQKH